MDREQLLALIGGIYIGAMVIIDLVYIATVVFTQLTFREFGRQSAAKRLINHGMGVSAFAWTLFLLGVLPAAINPLGVGERTVCIMFGIVCKTIGQTSQMVGWLRFWRAIKESFE